jgi:uncharacterized membrane protein
VLNPFSLPLHPAIVHFPIAMLSAAWVCLIIRHATKDSRWDARVHLLEVIGVAALPFVVAAGFIDTRGFDIVLNPRADAPLIWHMTSGLVATIVFATHYFWRRRYGTAELVGGLVIVDVALSTFGLIALLAATFLAAELVYGG